MRPLALLVAALVLAGCASSPDSATTTTTTSTPTTTTVANATDLPSGTQLVTITTAKGAFTFRLDPTIAPKATAHIADLVQKGFYTGIPFHRYVANFVVQGGDPKCKGDGWKNPGTSGCGTGGSGQTVPGEFKGKHDYGAVGLARSQSFDSGDSQLYFVNNPEGDHDLDGAYCVLGFVTQGMDVVMQLRAGDVMTNATLSTVP